MTDLEVAMNKALIGPEWLSELKAEHRERVDGGLPSLSAIDPNVPSYDPREPAEALDHATPEQGALSPRPFGEDKSTLNDEWAAAITGVSNEFHAPSRKDVLAQRLATTACFALTSATIRLQSIFERASAAQQNTKLWRKWAVGGAAVSAAISLGYAYHRLSGGGDHTAFISGNTSGASLHSHLQAAHESLQMPQARTSAPSATQLQELMPLKKSHSGLLSDQLAQKTAGKPLTPKAPVEHTLQLSFSGDTMDHELSKIEPQGFGTKAHNMLLKMVMNNGKISEHKAHFLPVGFRFKVSDKLVKLAQHLSQNNYSARHRS